MARTYKRVKRGNKITVQRPTRCIFCDALPPLSWEHVFSRWTHRIMPPRAMRKYHVMKAETYLEKSERALFKRPGDVRDFQVRCVCETRCNNGWMRKHVDEVAQLVMTPLIKGEPVRLSPADQKIIATWAAMKAMVAEFEDHAWVTTPYAQRKYLMRHLSPPPRGWSIWIGHYIRSRWIVSFGSIPFLYLSPLQERHREMRRGSDVRATYYNSHITTQVVGQLFIHAIRSPARKFVDGWRFSPPHKGALFRIWPPTTTSINWPGRTMTDQDADYAASALHMFLLDRIAAIHGPALAAT
jgi:hypothetical protein